MRELLVGRKPSMRQVLGLSALAVSALLGTGSVFIVRETRASVRAAASASLSQNAQDVRDEVERFFAGTRHVLDMANTALSSGALSPTDIAGLEAFLFTSLLNAPGLEEVTFTHAEVVGYDPAGEAQLADERYQLSLVRTDNHVVSTLVKASAPNAGFSAFERVHPVPHFANTGFAPKGASADPTTHPTFSVVTSKALAGQSVWSDLHYSEIGARRGERSVALTLQRAIPDANGRVAGVMRVGIPTATLDDIPHRALHAPDDSDRRRVALLATSLDEDACVRLVARLSSDDRLEMREGELAYVPEQPSPEFAALLQSSLLHQLNDSLDDSLERAGEMVVNGERWLVALRPLRLGPGGTEGWFVAVIAPEDFYTHTLTAFARNLGSLFGATLLALFGAGVGLLLAVQHGLQSLGRSTARMSSLDFAQSSSRTWLREFQLLHDSLERAKTAARALSKYVPVELVRQLYAHNHEVSLGGTTRELSLMFTDIQGFTSLAEGAEPERLARDLGQYLEVMVSELQGTHATIDKFIGDAVMAFWNAPGDCANHAEQACESVLRCQAALGRLFASGNWRLEPLVTRFGVHTAKVLVGHFGALSRLNYTALGDGVNLAARLEPLCKHYGVCNLVSHETMIQAASKYRFRHVDRVAVKGKLQSIDVYELIGRVSDQTPPHVATFERALRAYFARAFDTTIELLAPQVADGPSAVIYARARQWLQNPPSEEWNGSYAWHEK